MIPMRTTIFSFLTLAWPLWAGNFNVVHLAQQQDLTIVVECDKRSQEFTLAPASDSGTFALPEKEAQFRLKDQKAEVCKLKADKAGRIVVIYQKGAEILWHTVTSKAEKDRTSLRLINLTEEEVSLKLKDQTIALAAGKDHDAGVVESLSISVTLGDQKKQTAKAEEPTAFIGVVYPTPDGPKLHFVADR
jgi:hypothetical protein